MADPHEQVIKLHKEVSKLQEQLEALQAQLANVLKENGSKLSSHAAGDQSAALDDQEVPLPARPPLPAPAAPPGVPMATTRVVMHQIVLPSETDRLGICFGGQVLSWIDVCAGMSAKTLAKGPCVTATLDAVHFLRPCRLGTVVIIAAMVNRTFNSSMEVGVHVEAEDMHTGVRHHCCSAYLTFVTVTQKGVPHRVSLSGSAMYSSSGQSLPAPPPGPAIPAVSGSAALLAGLRGGAAAQPCMQLLGSRTGSAPDMPAALLPRVLPTTPEHVRVHQEAEARRKARLAERQRRRNDPELAKQSEMCRLRPVTHREGGAWLPASIKSPWTSTSYSKGNGKKLAVSIPRVMSMNTYTPAMMADASPQGNGSQHHTSEITPGSHSREPRISRLHVAGSTEDGDGVSDPHSAGGEAAPPPEPAEVPSALQAHALTSPISHTCSTESSETEVQSPGVQPAVPPRLTVSPSLTVAYITQSILPQHANTLGITFGGQVMSWMEQCAYISASRLRAPHLLTAAIDDLTFIRPTCVGDILYVTSQVTSIFGSSLEVQVCVHGEDPHVGELFHCADGYVTLVTVAAEDDEQGGKGTPVKLPFTLDPGTPAEVLQARGATQRRDERLKLRSRLAENQPIMPDGAAFNTAEECTE